MTHTVESVNASLEKAIERRISEQKNELINLQALIIRDSFNALRELNDELLCDIITKEKAQQKIFDLLMKHDHVTQVNQRELTSHSQAF